MEFVGELIDGKVKNLRVLEFMKLKYGESYGCISLVFFFREDNGFIGICKVISRFDFRFRDSGIILVGI